MHSALRERLDREGGHVVTDPVVAEALARARRKPRNPRLAEKLDAIARGCAALPVLDPRTPEEIIGYDEHGAPR